MSRYLISIDSIREGDLQMYGFNQEEIQNLIYIKPKKKNDIKKQLYEKFNEMPVGSEVILYIKIHGSKEEKRSQGLEILQSVYDHKLLVNSSEITDIVEFGRGVKGFKICGILHICHGYTYNKLVNCFDMCIS